MKIVSHAVHTSPINIGQHGSGARALNPCGAERGLHRVSREYESRLSGENEGSTQSWSQAESSDTRLRESQVFRGGETRRQEWYCECSGDWYLYSGAEVEDTSQEMMETTRWESERIQVSRHCYPTLAKWNGQSCSVGAAESRARDNVK